MKIVFMGTPDFAVPALKALISKHEVTAVFTQPDKPKGRGQKMQITPVKEAALKFSIPVYQPQKLKGNVEIINIIRNLNPDAIVVVAFGQILPKEILEIPGYGCINIHASLLPELRGAAPINWAIIRGNKTTGITTMKMSEGLDTGDMLLKEEITIGEDETAGELHDRLMNIGAELILKTIQGILDNTIKAVPQDDSKSSYAPMLTKELGHIDWGEDSEKVYNLIRGVIPWPGAYFFYKDRMIKIWKAERETSTSGRTPGEITDVNVDGIRVACSRGSIVIRELQEVGGKRMDAASYLNGHEIKRGEILK